jgi:hypothetical protein
VILAGFDAQGKTAKAVFFGETILNIPLLRLFFRFDTHSPGFAVVGGGLTK